METLDSKPDKGFETESSQDADREQARKQLQERRDFGSHLVAYVVINAFLIVVWAVTGAGYFWPAWVLAGWGAGLVLHAWEVFVRRPITEADIDAELRRRVRDDVGHTLYPGEEVSPCRLRRARGRGAGRHRHPCWLPVICRRPGARWPPHRRRSVGIGVASRGVRRSG